MESKQNKKEIEQWAFLREIIDAFPFYVIIVDETHHIITANAAVRKQLGVDPDTIVGTFCPKEVHGLDSPYPGCPLEEAAKKDQSIVKEMFYEESQNWVESSAFLTNRRTKEGKRIFIHTIQDITKRKLVEEKLNQKIQDLEKWQKLTVGREIKMIELKKEISELKKRLKKQESD
jgi:PAS domain S-box-containing protein